MLFIWRLMLVSEECFVLVLLPSNLMHTNVHLTYIYDNRCLLMNAHYNLQEQSNILISFGLYNIVLRQRSQLFTSHS